MFAGPIAGIKQTVTGTIGTVKTLSHEISTGQIGRAAGTIAAIFAIAAVTKRIAADPDIIPADDLPPPTRNPVTPTREPAPARTTTTPRDTAEPSTMGASFFPDCGSL